MNAKLEQAKRVEEEIQGPAAPGGQLQQQQYRAQSCTQELNIAMNCAGWEVEQ